jgi:hypothetical protein
MYQQGVGGLRFAGRPWKRFAELGLDDEKDQQCQSWTMLVGWSGRLELEEEVAGSKFSGADLL